MRISFFLFLFIPYLLFSADGSFSARSRHRHKKLQEHLIKELAQDKYLTGNWGGGRTLLAEQGITLGSYYLTNIAGNPVGGRARGIAYAGSWGLDLLIDLGKKTSLKGWSIYSSMVWRTGTNLSSRKIGNQFPVQQVFGSQTVKLNSLYIEKITENERVHLRLGRINGGDLFLTSPLFQEYMNNAFDGNPISIFFNTPFTAYPNAVWGAYLELKPYSSLSLKGAALQGNQKVQKNRFHGVDFTFSSPQGVVVPVEIGWLRPEADWPGNYRLGAVFVTEGAPKFLGGVSENNYNIYLQLDQMLYRDSQGEQGEGLYGLFTTILGPKSHNQFPFFFISGLLYKGLISSRREDYTVLGLAYGHYSQDLQMRQEIEGNKVQKGEWIVEINHKFQLNPWFFIQPDVQFVINPKGFEDIKAAWVIGVQSGVLF